MLPPGAKGERGHMQECDRIRADLLAIDFVVGELIGVLADVPDLLPRLTRARDRLREVLWQGWEEGRDREFGDRVQQGVANLFSGLPD